LIAFISLNVEVFIKCSCRQYKPSHEIIFEIRYSSCGDFALKEKVFEKSEDRNKYYMYGNSETS